VFVQDFQVVDIPFGLAAEVVETDAGNLLRAALLAAQEEAARLRMTVAPPGWPGVLAQRVQIRYQELRRVPDGALLSFGWAAERGLSLVPLLEGDLVVTPMGDPNTHLVLRGCYEPVTGAPGWGVDPALAHRMAETVLRTFLDRLCIELRDAAKRYVDNVRT
jgi:hypothetical protein